jgi:hypothetical protein
MPTIDEFKKFDRLAPADKIEARISWLERKIVEILWLVIGLTALAMGALAAWLVRDAMEMHSMWVYGPVAAAVWGVTGWLLKRRAFRGAPPHIDFIDP